LQKGAARQKARLAEAGARFIEVKTKYIPFLNWATCTA